jgi:hypothetical protein
VISAEKEDIAGQHQNLDQAEGAQETMSQEGARASEESKKGEEEGKAVQSEGNNLSVEAKPEDPETRSWLERAWDATGGALWDELVGPAVAAVKRKVEQVMQKITEFIMKMINQALGLDEIEQQLNAGGVDIGDRRAALQETEGGLDEGQTQSQEAQQQNQAAVEQATSNVEEAVSVQEEAEQLLAALQEQDTILAEEESAALAYVRAFGARYAAFFRPESAGADGASRGVAALVEAAAQDSSDGAGGAAATSAPGEQVTEAQVAQVVIWIESTRRGAERAQLEINQVAQESASAIAPEYRGEERAGSAAATAAHRESHATHLGRLDELLAQAKACVGLPLDDGSTRLQGIVDGVMDVAQKVESSRAQALEAIGMPHARALRAGAAPPAAPNAVS